MEKRGRKDKKKKDEKKNSLTRLTRATACPTQAAYPLPLKSTLKVNTEVVEEEGARTS